MIADLKVNASPMTQAHMVYFYLPFTKGGESSRWSVAIVDDEKGLDVLWANKLVNKDCARGFLRAMVSTQIAHQFAIHEGVLVLQFGDKAQGVASLYEDTGKEALKRLITRKGEAKAKDDPMYSHLHGKADSPYAQNLLLCYLHGESLLSFANPRYT